MPEPIRCAIYTRKSTEEGLEQDFNSLDAQREACAAFIASQRHEGWIAVPEAYEDGGFSGGSMNRPGLQKLFEDIRAGKVNTIVVYKIDRLTRSLADFAKMVELFDAQKVTFVSVTQQFNTTTSMGRLTLNVLLSFAQFEREISGERIRDKVAASKAKGMWMGGNVPLGYRVEDRRLHAEPTEAMLVRRMFRLYAELGSVIRVRDLLNSEGTRTRSGKRFMTGALANLLCNPVYIGKVTHKGKVHPGNHAGIIDMGLWDRVQEMRRVSKHAHRHQVRAKERSLLAGKLFDAECNPMSPAQASKSGRRYRYYISQGTIQGRPLHEATITRIPAGEVEDVISRFTRQLFADDERISRFLPNLSLFRRQRAQGISEGWDRLPPVERHVLVRTVLAKACLRSGEVEVRISRAGLEAALSGQEHVTTPSNDDISQLIPVRIAPVEGGGVFLIASGEVGRTRPPNMELVRAVARAHAGNGMLVRGQDGQEAVAKKLGMDERRLRELLPLAWLAPDIVEAVLAGRQPVDLTIGKLLGIAASGNWQAQRERLGR